MADQWQIAGLNFQQRPLSLSHSSSESKVCTSCCLTCPLWFHGQQSEKWPKEKKRVKDTQYTLFYHFVAQLEAKHLKGYPSTTRHWLELGDIFRPKKRYTFTCLFLCHLRFKTIVVDWHRDIELLAFKGLIHSLQNKLLLSPLLRFPPDIGTHFSQQYPVSVNLLPYIYFFTQDSDSWVLNGSYTIAKKCQ